MSKRLLILMCSIFLVVPLLFMGCSGDDGSTGAAGATGPPGPPGVGVLAPTQLESCAICHNDQTIRNGDAHQADYDQRFQDQVVTVDNVAYAYSAVDNSHTVTFVLKRKNTSTGTNDPFDCTQIKTGAPADSLSIGFAEYNAATRTFDPPAPLESALSLGSQASLKYDNVTNICSSKTFDNNALGQVGNLALRNGIIEINGRDDRQGTLPSPSRVQLSLFPFAGLLKTGTPGAVNYASAAVVSGCENCHTVPYLKHGFIYGRIGGVAGDNATDFYTCKGCHMDNARPGDKPGGGHQIWQLLVNDPQRAASFEAGVPLTPAETIQYAYKTRLMNDVHMSHAMEFAYPQSMANCATCHEGKLGALLTDNNFVAETCKSCHPVTGGTDTLGNNDKNDNTALQFTVDTRTKNPLLKQAPALKSILPSFHFSGNNVSLGDCVSCHPGQFITRSTHTGYDKVIYGVPGTKYSASIITTIDNVSYVDNTNTLKFGFSATGIQGVGFQAASSANIVPTILVGLYGFDTKDYLFGPHESEGSPSKRLLEFSTAIPAPSNNSTRITVVKGSGTSWNVTADLSTWKPWIDNNSVKRVEVAVLPTLKNADNVVVALNAPSKTFNLGTKLIEDFTAPTGNPPAGHAKDFFGNSIVKVPGGRISPPADPSMSGCNNCHNALGTTFHSPDRGGNVIVCRLCHTTKSAGSHLELQSRSIDSYIHAIHRFQDFDTGSIDFTDAVEAMEYEHHVESNFPTFGIEDCRACHNASKFNVPDQAKSLPGVLSNTDFSTTRNIAPTDNDVITGPAARACGACHRAEAIIANAGAGDAIFLANLNSHMTTFGYTLKSPPAKIMDVITQIFDSFGDNGTILVGP